MKKKIFIITLLGILLLPIGAKAATKTVLGENYETKSFTEALEDEGIEKQFSNYQESDDKITIYLFRGKGCSFCKAYLTFMDSITEEYGKYFNMVSFEVWNDENNWNLMQRVSYYMRSEIAGGVPYVIIGDKVFPGFTESYGEDIKKAIVDLYNTNKNERYDIFEKVEKDGLISIDELKAMYDNGNNNGDGNGNGSEVTTYGEDNSSNNSSKSNTPVILWNLLFVAVGTTSVILFNNYKFNSLKNDLIKNNNLEKKGKSKSKRK